MLVPYGFLMLFTISCTWPDHPVEWSVPGRTPGKRVAVFIQQQTVIYRIFNETYFIRANNVWMQDRRRVRSEIIQSHKTPTCIDQRIIINMEKFYPRKQFTHSNNIELPAAWVTILRNEVFLSSLVASDVAVFFCSSLLQRPPRQMFSSHNFDLANWSRTY